ncbi:MAG TPA: hypothetical protein VN577_06610 [Terriglobales bacterium]|nr:hypothetical protein [Terriglobales bacterium]
MKSVLKSVLLAFVGTGLFFFFLMMGVVPIMATIARMTGDVSSRSVVVDPGVFFRTWGIPLAVVAFLICFAVGMYRFRRLEHPTFKAAGRN